MLFEKKLVYAVDFDGRKGGTSLPLWWWCCWQWRVLFTNMWKSGFLLSTTIIIIIITEKTRILYIVIYLQTMPAFPWLLLVTKSALVKQVALPLLRKPILKCWSILKLLSILSWLKLCVWRKRWVVTGRTLIPFSVVLAHSFILKQECTCHDLLFFLLVLNIVLHTDVTGPQSRPHHYHRSSLRRSSYYATVATAFPTIAAAFTRACGYFCFRAWQ